MSLTVQHIKLTSCHLEDTIDYLGVERVLLNSCHIFPKTFFESVTVSRLNII